MSHWLKCDVVFTDEAALQTAVEALGLRLSRCGTARGYRATECDLTIRLNGPYDVALKREAGTLVAYYDDYKDDISRELGQNLGKLKGEYAAVIAKRQAARSGWRVQRATNRAGHIVLTLSR